MRREEESKTINIGAWKTPASSYPRSRMGSAEIRTHNYKKGLYRAYNTGPTPGETYEYYFVTRTIATTILKIRGRVVMTDDCAHWWAIQDHATHYHGHVLVAGLGLGLIVHALADNPNVERVTVVEREADVINLVNPLLKQRDGWNTVCQDWYKYEPADKVDAVFFDLFVGDGPKLWPLAIREMIEMRQRFGDVPIGILGFDNNYLKSIADVACNERGIRELLEMACVSLRGFVETGETDRASSEHPTASGDGTADCGPQSTSL